MQEYINFVSELESEVRSCGRLIREASGAITYSQKSHRIHDAVTDFDITVENRLAQKLHEIDPTIPVVGEESGGNRSKGRHWLIDPIDGTLHFTRGIPFSTIMLALIEDTIPVLGIIYVIADDSFYSAVRGAGAYKNGEKIHVSNRSAENALALVEINLEKEKNVLLPSYLAPHMMLANLGCAGYEYTLIADGRAEARICMDPRGSDYDFAPGAIIVQEAGGVVKNLDGSDYSTLSDNFITASSMDIYRTITDLVKEKLTKA